MQHNKIIGIWPQEEGPLIGEDKLNSLNNSVESGRYIDNVFVPEDIKNKWVSGKYPHNGKENTYPKLDDSGLEEMIKTAGLNCGDMFNGILFGHSEKGKDSRLFQFNHKGYVGYVKDYPIGISDIETISEKNLKNGLVYRLEIVTFNNSGEKYIYSARPLYLVVGEDAAKLNFQPFAVNVGDMFYLKIKDFRNKNKRPYGNYLNYDCFVQKQSKKKVLEGDNLLVKVVGIFEKKLRVKLRNAGIPEEEYEKYKRRIFRKGKCEGA